MPESLFVESNALDLQVCATLPNVVTEATWQTWFAVWLAALAVTDPCELSLTLTSDEQVQDLNQAYRQVDAPTDVLAFAAQESLSPLWAQTMGQIAEMSQTLILGDIVISVPTAQKQAQVQGHSEEIELAWLATHGLLHLLGWDHPDEVSLQQMLLRQAELLALVNLSVGVNYGISCPVTPSSPPRSS